MKTLKFAAKKILRTFNLDVRRIGAAAAPAWLPHADPLTLQYLQELDPAPLFPVRVSEARAGIAGFACEANSGHPLVAAFRAAQSAGSPSRIENAIRETLVRYYEVVTPSGPGEVLGLSSREAPGLVDVSLHSWVFPWSERSQAETERYRGYCLEEEGLSRGQRLSLADGMTFYGPVSARKIDLEVKRIFGLYQSMMKSGYRNDPSHPLEVIGLRARDDYRWLVTQGQHRFAACAAFGERIVDARVVRIIRREDAEYWPHVVARTFTSGGALACFDRIFSGEPFAAAAAWTQSRDAGRSLSASGIPDSFEMTARSLPARELAPAAGPVARE